MSTKTQAYEAIINDVNTLVANTKVSKAFQEQLFNLLSMHLAPKTGGGVSSNPPKEIDGIMHYFCRYHQTYEIADNMVMSQGKSKGYCKAAIAKWNKAQRSINKLESEATQAILASDLETAQTKSAQARELEELKNKPEYYNLEIDWAEFNA